MVYDPGVHDGSDNSTGPAETEVNDIDTAIVRDSAVVESKVTSYRMPEIGTETVGGGLTAPLGAWAKAGAANALDAAVSNRRMVFTCVRYWDAGRGAMFGREAVGRTPDSRLPKAEGRRKYAF